MDQVLQQKSTGFVDRRSIPSNELPAGVERRQFRDAHNEAHPDVAELADAVDQYKLRHRRRFITFEELHSVICGLGYSK